MPTIRLNKRAIEAIPHPPSGQVLYRDTLLKGFGLRAGKRSKVYFAEGQVNGRTRRATIGRADVFTPEAARKRALAHLGEMAKGRNPNDDRRRRAAKRITLAAAFEQFFEARTHHSPHTVSGYGRTARLYLKSWRKTPLDQISGQMVLKRHRQIASEHGETTANNVMRHLRSVYNFIAATRDEFPPNPALTLTQARAWYRERPRQTIIAAHELPAWWQAVMAEPEYSRDLLRMALLAGMRRGELMRLRWENVDLTARTLHLADTKNHDPLDLPLSDFLVRLLSERRARAGNSPWVFPGPGMDGHMKETKRFLARVEAGSGVKFTLHDLRRTFITIAESLDVPYYALKRLLNHRSGGDVTGGYIVVNAERLRGPVEQVAIRILELAGEGQ